MVGLKLSLFPNILHCLFFLREHDPAHNGKRVEYCFESTVLEEGTHFGSHPLAPRRTAGLSAHQGLMSAAIRLRLSTDKLINFIPSTCSILRFCRAVTFRLAFWPQSACLRTKAAGPPRASTPHSWQDQVQIIRPMCSFLSFVMCGGRVCAFGFFAFSSIP